MKPKLGRMIGAGGFGEVFLATRPGDSREFALKRLGSSADPEAEARFRREVRIQKKLRRPNVVPHYFTTSGRVPESGYLARLNAASNKPR